MEAWKKISILLCIFGVIKEFRPIEPYLTKYLNNPPMNFSLEEVRIFFIKNIHFPCYNFIANILWQLISLYSF